MPIVFAVETEFFFNGAKTTEELFLAYLEDHNLIAFFINIYNEDDI